jgi:hypothetical protein
MRGLRPSRQPENAFHRLYCLTKISHSLLAILCTLFVIGFVSTHAMAASVHLKWDPTDPAPDGYRVLIRAAGSTYNYNTPVWIGTDSDCQLKDLPPGTTYYMVVRAYVGDVQSSDSNEVSYPPAAETNLETSAPSAEDTASNDAGTSISGDAPNVSPDLQQITTLQIVSGE